MCAQALRSYFETDHQQRRALEALGDWFTPGELDLYDASRCAFDPLVSADEAFQYFEKIYDELASSRWNAFRPHRREKCWPPKQIFETIKREFGIFMARLRQPAKFSEDRTQSRIPPSEDAKD